MTNEEAVRILRRIQEPEAWEPQINGAAFEALDMAIEALGQKQAAGSKDLISRRAAINMCRKPRMRNADCSDFEMEIMMLPSAEPKRGKWIRVGSGSLYDYYKCSECGKQPKWDCMGDNRWKIAFTDFCPNCGADMRGEQNG